MDGITLTHRRDTEPSDMRPTHVMHREFWKGGRMRITISRYPDGSFTVKAPIDLTDADILSLDWSKNSFGWALHYPNGLVTSCGGFNTPHDPSEVNPFGHLLPAGYQYSE